MRKLFLVIIAHWVIGSVAFSIRYKYGFEHLSSRDGLMQSAITCIYQDSRGFLWLGSYNGLICFDGYNFREFKEDPKDTGSLSANYVSCIFEDKYERLWIGTMGGGVNIYDPRKESFSRILLSDTLNNKKNPKRITFIKKDSHNRIHIGSWDNGLFYFENEDSLTAIYQTFENYHQIIFYDLTEDKSGSLWYATNHGIISCKSPGEINKHFTPKNSDLGSNDIRKLIIEDENVIWCGSWGGGLFKFLKSEEKFISYKEKSSKNPLSNNFIRDLHIDKEKSLWIATNGGGINRLDLSTNTIHYYNNEPGNNGSLSNDIVLSLFEDRSRILWIGTELGGLNKINLKRSQFNHTKLKGEKSINSVYSICSDEENDDVIWLGTFGGGLVRYNNRTQKHEQFLHNPHDPYSLSNDNVRCLIRDHKGQLWIGTEYGLNVYNSKSGRFKKYYHDPSDTSSIGYNSIFCLFEDSKNRIWVGTFEGGLNKYKPESDNFIRYKTIPGDTNSINDISIWTIREDNDGILWIGTELGGLNRFDPESELFKNYLSNKGESQREINKVLCICITRNNQVWVGSSTSLHHFNRSDERFTPLGEGNNNQLNTVQSILEDKNGNFWCGTTNGLVKFNPKINKFSHFNIADGVQGGMFFVNSCFSMKNGQIIFGGNNGFNIFHPDSVDINNHLPEIAITDFKLFNTQVNINQELGNNVILENSILFTDQIILSPNQNVFSFEYTALDFVSPTRNEYKYMLEGFDKKWNNANTRRFASYTNIKPGNYVFKVMGSNNNGLWNENPARINVIIQHHLWQKPWFIVTVSIIFLIINFFLIQRRIKTVKDQRIKLEQEIEKRTSDLKVANQRLEERQHMIEKQAEELKVQKENLEDINVQLEERQEEIEHQSLKLKIQADSLKESNDLLIQREKEIRKQAEMLEEQADYLEETNRKLLLRQEEIEHQSLKLKIQSDALAESNMLLEQRGRQIRRQADKLEEQAESLKKANAELEKLNATKDRFFSIIAHDLRNPINAILGFSELISANYDAIDDKKKLELNKIIHASTKNVYNLLENLLQWSRSQTNRIKFEPVQFDVSGVINENVLLSRANIKKKNIKVGTHFSNDNLIFADKNMVSAVLRNILTNAIKFTPDQGSIEIQTKDEESHLIISVTDTGIGISEDRIQDLFRIDKTHSTYGTSGEMGTGLGLIICKEFVEKHQGKLEVKSTIGKGSTFYFSMPKNETQLKDMNELSMPK